MLFFVTALQGLELLPPDVHILRRDKTPAANVHTYRTNGATAARNYSHIRARDFSLTSSAPVSTSLRKFCAFSKWQSLHDKKAFSKTVPSVGVDDALVAGVRNQKLSTSETMWETSELLREITIRQLLVSMIVFEHRPERDGLFAPPPLNELFAFRGGISGFQNLGRCCSLPTSSRTDICFYGIFAV